MEFENTTFPFMHITHSGFQVIWGFWMFLYLVTAIVGIIGNAIIAWIVLAHRSMKTIPNVYIGNMAVGNILIALFALPFIFPYHTWKMKPVVAKLFCTIQEYSISVGLCVFAFSLTLLAIERWYTITSPKKELPSIKSWPTLKIWLISFIVSVPNWIYFYMEYMEHSSYLHICTPLPWPKLIDVGVNREIYSSTLSVFTYVIPLTINTFLVARLGVKLWNSKSADFILADKAEYKRWLWILAGHVLVFGLTWFPFRTSSLLSGNIKLSILVPIHELILYYLLTMIGILYLPIIFCFLDARFKKKSRKVIRWCPGVDYESKSLNYALDGSNHRSINMTEMYRPISDV